MSQELQSGQVGSSDQLVRRLVDEGSHDVGRAIATSRDRTRTEGDRLED